MEPYEAHLSIGTTAWIGCPLPEKKTDVIRQLAAVPGLGRLGGAPYLLGNNQDSAGRCLQWFRDTATGGSRRLDPVVRGDHRARGDRSGGPPVCVFTPGWPVSGARSTTERRAEGSTTSRSPRRPRTWLARCSRAWPSTRVGCWRPPTTSPASGSTRSGWSAEARSPTLWCQIVADVCDRTVERVADPLLCGLRGAALAGGMAVGDVDRDELRRLVPVDRTFRPDGSQRAAYDRLYAEFPHLYRSQRRMFRRLNRRP